MKEMTNPNPVSAATHTKAMQAAIIPCGTNLSDFLPGRVMNYQNFRTDIPTKASMMKTTPDA